MRVLPAPIPALSLPVVWGAATRNMGGVVTADFSAADYPSADYQNADYRDAVRPEAASVKVLSARVATQEPTEVVVGSLQMNPLHSLRSQAAARVYEAISRINEPPTSGWLNISA